MSKHPLADVSEQYAATGYIMQWNTSQFDDFGNPSFDKTQPIDLKLIIKSSGSFKDTTVSSQPGTDTLFQIVKCFIIEPTDYTFEDLIKLAPRVDLADGRKLQITDKSQRQLKTLNRVFGVQFKAMLITNVV